MQRTRVNSRRKALKSSVDEEAAGVHQSVRFSLSLLRNLDSRRYIATGNECKETVREERNEKKRASKKRKKAYGGCK